MTAGIGVDDLKRISSIEAYECIICMHTGLLWPLGELHHCYYIFTIHSAACILYLVGCHGVCCCVIHAWALLSGLLYHARRYTSAPLYLFLRRRNSFCSHLATYQSSMPCCHMYWLMVFTRISSCFRPRGLRNCRPWWQNCTSWYISVLMSNGKVINC